MLAERKELLEHEVRRLQSEAANMYLSIVVSGNEDLNSAEYQKIKTMLADRVFDLNMINDLIAQGRE